MNSFANLKTHVLNRITNTPITPLPFYSLYIESIFSSELYQALYNHMITVKYTQPLDPRRWDNPEYENKRYKIANNPVNIVQTVIQLFGDTDIQQALLNKFYHSNQINPTEVVFTEDLQYVFTDKDRYQVIHTDIPAQFLSVVFYLPETTDLTELEEQDNATMLYDKALFPYPTSVKYKPNSVLCFAPHFYSYHGFNTTIANRNTMQFFYAQKDLFKRFYDAVQNENGEQDPETFKQLIFWKLTQYRLREYDDGDPMAFLTKLLREHANCLVNKVNGRVSVKNDI